ncbi:hypothetical protein SCYAM73S_02085 [Streptomyces cyaneofuscatus]
MSTSARTGSYVVRSGGAPLPASSMTSTPRPATLLTRVIADAVAEGLIARSGAATGDSKPGEKAAGEPLAEWERDLLEGDKKDETAAAAEVQSSAETEKVADAEKPAEAVAEAEAAAEAADADAEQA